MAFPPTPVASAQFGYTSGADLTPAVQPGTWRWPQTTSMRAVFGSVDAGNEPSGSDFTADILVDGAPVATVTILDGDQDGITVVSPAVQVPSGSLIQLEITDDGGATGPVTLGWLG